MRRDNLRMDGEEERRLPGYGDAAVVRRFDAPEAMDIRFYEVRAKSAINRVPEASKVPFRFTINPYRGCTHACTYCLGEDTPILLANGLTKPIADLRVGDAIYGTAGEGVRRRVALTEVLAHWETRKPAYRITLGDGRRLVASGDHRFLTRRGWKHVSSGEHGGAGLLDLAAADELVGTEQLEGPPDGPSETSGSPAGTAAKTARELKVVSIEPLGVELPLYDITTGTGDFIANGVVTHNCFARPTHTYLDFDAGRDFEREIVVKVNLPEVVRAELARPSWKGEHVALGTNTDPYQWVEGRYKLMPGVWEAFRDAANPASILTKSPLLLRDLSLLRELSDRAPFTAAFSVPTLEEKTWRATEPHTPHPRARLEAVAELTRAGIPTSVLVAPLMPGVNDAPEQVEPILELASEAGATSIGGIALHLRSEVREVFFDWLRAERPDLIPRYEELYRRGAYAPPAERRRLAALVARGAPPPCRDPGDVMRRGSERAAPPESRLPPHAGTPARQEALF